MGKKIKEILKNAELRRKRKDEEEWVALKKMIGEEKVGETREALKKIADKYIAWNKLWNIAVKEMYNEWYRENKDKPWSSELLDKLEEKLKKKLLKPFSPVELPSHYILPTKLEKKIRPIFQTSISSKDLIKEEKIGKELLLVYRKDDLTREIYFNILRGRLETLKDTKTLSLGDLGWRAFIATLGFAFKQGTLSPVFTKTDKLKCLGYTEEQLKRGGRIYELIEKMEKLLTYLSYNIVDKRKGKGHRETIGHLYERLEIRGEGKGAIYNPKLSEETLGKDLPYIIEEGTNGISYKLYHPELLQDKELSPEQRRLCAYLVGLRGFKVVEKTARYLLLDIMGMSGKQFKTRPKECHNMLINMGLEIAKKKGYLENYKINYREDPLNVRRWSLTLYLPKERKQVKKEKVRLPKGSNLIDKITEWNSRDVFDTRTPKEEIRKQVANTVRKYGEEAIEKIFKSELSKSWPHPMNFWNDVKKLKRLAKY